MVLPRKWRVLREKKQHRHKPNMFYPLLGLVTGDNGGSVEFNL